VKFLVDQNLSPIFVEEIGARGHDAEARGEVGVYEHARFGRLEQRDAGRSNGVASPVINCRCQ